MSKIISPNSYKAYAITRDYVFHVRGTAGSRISEPHDLNGRGMQCEDLVSGAFSVAVHVEQDVDAVRVNPISRLKVATDL